MTSPVRPTAVLSALLSVLVLGLLTANPLAAHEPEPCTQCEEARKTNGWCDACGVGWVGDVELRSKHLWHILDAHGHRLNVENLGCDDCVKASVTGGYCAKSKIGFVDGEAYFSRLTWALARGEQQEGVAPECATCREHSTSAGWCEACGVGRVGNRAFRDRAEFEQLLQDLEILQIASEAADRCEYCAAAIVTDTECPYCRIEYKGGAAVTRP